MVRHGKDKKRRAGRTGKTKLKNRNYLRWNPKPAFTDSVIKAQWDPSKSPAVNMRNMGLVAKPSNEGGTCALVQQKTTPVIELYEVPDSDSLAKKTRPMSERDQKYIAKCLAKHGEEYTVMFRDTKVNNMQHTEHQLRKMASRFLLLEEEQRVVDIPEKIQAAESQAL